MVQQTGPQELSPIPGKRKNCNGWADYEAPQTTPGAQLCNGGWYEGDYYDTCPVRQECQVATRAKTEPRLIPTSTLSTPRPLAPSTTPWRPSVPSYAPSAPLAQYQQHSQYPTPITPPESYPEVMRTPFTAPMALGGAGISPTFLPAEGEGILSRLGKNIAQGGIAAMGYHIFDLARNVDFFRR